MNTLLSQLYKHRYQIIFCQMFSLAKYRTVFTNLVPFCLRFPVCSLWLVKETVQSWIVFVVFVTKRNTWDLHSCWLLADHKCIPCSPGKIFWSKFPVQQCLFQFKLLAIQWTIYFLPDSARNLGVVGVFLTLLKRLWIFAILLHVSCLFFNLWAKVSTDSHPWVAYTSL